MLPGAIAGAAAYWVYLIHTHLFSAGWEFGPEEPYVGVLFGLTAGALIGSAAATIMRAFRSKDSGTEAP